MVTVINKNLHHAITICGKKILPQEKYSFDKVDMQKINYYISTGDIEIRYETSADVKFKSTLRKRQTKDTIIIDSGDADNDSSDEEINKDKEM